MYWAIIKSILYYNIGVKISNDSPRYLEYADYLLNRGHLTFDFISHYIFYCLFIAFFKFFSVKIGWVIFAQIVISGVACYFLYCVSLKLFHSISCACTTVVLYTSWIYVQAWDFYILTESMFVSCTIALLYAMVCLRGFKKYFNCLILILVIATLRPNGFIIAVCFAAYELCDIYYSKSRLFAVFIVGLGVFLTVVLFYVSLSLDDYYHNFIYPNYLMGEIISGYPQLRIDTKGLINPGKNGSPIYMILEFISNNPCYYLKLIFSKALFFWGHIKPYYSILHNCVIIIILYPCYILAFSTLKSKILPNNLRIFFIFYFILQTSIVASYMEDWDGRFLAPLLPLVFLLAGGCAANCRFYTLNGSICKLKN